MLISKGFACCEAEDGVEALSEMSAMYVRKSVRHGVNNLENNGSIRVGVPADIDTSRDNPSTQVAAVHRRSSQIIRIGSHAAKETKHRQFAIDAVLIDSNMPRMNGPGGWDMT
jgi:CheY-like chemotaxis protein